MQSVSGQSVPVFNEGLLGQGEIIGCADTGIDMDVLHSSLNAQSSFRS